MTRRSLGVIGLACCVVTATMLAGSAGASLTPFRLTFDGSHHPATFPTPLGLQHEGPFTASSPFCPSGYATDIRHETQPLAALRRFACTNGDSITLRIAEFPGEHDLGFSADWRIVDGTGQYGNLRGSGTWTSLSVGGDPANPATVTFRTVSEGFVAFDAVAPTVAISKGGLRRLPGPGNMYTLRLVFSAQDDIAGNVVSYKLTVRTGAGQQLASKSGETTSGPISASLGVHLPRAARTVKVVISATDPVGNERVLARTVPVRH